MKKRIVLTLLVALAVAFVHAMREPRMDVVIAAKDVRDGRWGKEYLMTFQEANGETHERAVTRDAWEAFQVGQRLEGFELRYAQ